MESVNSILKGLSLKIGGKVLLCREVQKTYLERGKYKMIKATMEFNLVQVCSRIAQTLHIARAFQVIRKRVIGLESRRPQQGKGQTKYYDVT